MYKKNAKNLFSVHCSLRNEKWTFFHVQSDFVVLKFLIAVLKCNLFNNLGWEKLFGLSGVQMWCADAILQFCIHFTSKLTFSILLCTLIHNTRAYFVEHKTIENVYIYIIDKDLIGKLPTGSCCESRSLNSAICPPRVVFALYSGGYYIPTCHFSTTKQDQSSLQIVIVTACQFREGWVWGIMLNQW